MPWPHHRLACWWNWTTLAKIWHIFMKSLMIATSPPTSSLWGTKHGALESKRKTPRWGCVRAAVCLREEETSTDRAQVAVSKALRGHAWKETGAWGIWRTPPKHLTFLKLLSWRSMDVDSCPPSLHLTSSFFLKGKGEFANIRLVCLFMLFEEILYKVFFI